MQASDRKTKRLFLFTMSFTSQKIITWFAFVVFALLPNLLFAQKDFYSISGIVCDSATHNPQSSATIRLLQTNNQSKLLKSVKADAKGCFTASVSKEGIYTIEALVLGMQPTKQTVILTKSNPRISIDTIYVKEYSSSLSSATVTANKQLIKTGIDKITYSMTDDSDSQTSTTLEMLRKVPMVTVDGEDNIKVNGNSNFKIYVNGKPNQMMSQNPSTILKSYPASAIKKIEVITNPGAKYDAEGVAGILNIITHDEAQTTGYVLTPQLTYTNRGVRGNFFGMAQFGKFTFSINYGLGQDKQKRNSNTTERELFSDNTNHFYRNYQENDGEGLFQYGSIDASYELSQKDLLSFSAGLFRIKYNQDGKGYNELFSATNDTIYKYSVYSRNEVLYMNTNAAADWQHTFKKNQHLTFSYRFNHSPNETKSDYLYSDLCGTANVIGLNDKKANPNKLSYEHTAQIDFSTPLGKCHTLSTGLKYVYRINRSNNYEYSRPAATKTENYELDEDQSLRYRHRSDIGAAYLEYAYKYKNWALIVGNRYEYFHLKVSYPDKKRSAFSSVFNDWVPSFSIGYNFQPTMMVKMDYNIRLRRPDISYLSPYRESPSPESVTYGNPNLGSTKAHNINLTYSTFSAKFTFNAALTYSFSNNELVEYSFIDKGVINTTFGDFLHKKDWILSTYINWTIVNGTVFNANISASYTDYIAKIRNESNSGFQANIYGGIRQNLPWKLEIGAWLGGGTKDIELQGENGGFYFYSLNLSRSFLKEERLTVVLEAANFIGRYQRFRNTTTTSSFRQTVVQKSDFFRIGIGLRYRLGSLKAQVKKVARTIEDSDVISNNNSNSNMQISTGN